MNLTEEKTLSWDFKTKYVKLFCSNQGLTYTYICRSTILTYTALNQQAREMTSDWETSHKCNKADLNRLRQLSPGMRVRRRRRSRRRRRRRRRRSRRRRVLPWLHRVVSNQLQGETNQTHRQPTWARGWLISVIKGCRHLSPTYLYCPGRKRPVLFCVSSHERNEWITWGPITVASVQGHFAGVSK